MAFSHAYAHNPIHPSSYDSQQGASIWPNQEHAWAAPAPNGSGGGTASHHPLTMDATHIPAQGLTASGSYPANMAAHFHQPPSAIPHTQQSTTEALDLTSSLHPIHPTHPMSGYAVPNAYPGYATAPAQAHGQSHAGPSSHAQRSPVYGRQHHPASFSQHYVQPAQEQIHIGHPVTYSGAPAAVPQLQTLVERRIAAMPTRRGGAPVATPYPVPAAAPSPFDMNEAMRRSIIDIPASSSIISPASSPSVELVSPPLSTAGKGLGSKNTKTKAPKRVLKRKKGNPPPEEEDIDEDDEDDDVSGGGKKDPSKRACRRCKAQKIKCSLTSAILTDQGRCEKCKNHGLTCVVDPIRPSRNPNKKEYFLAQIREKDSIIESLIKEKYNPYSATPLSVKSFRETAVPGTDAFAYLGKLQEGASRPAMASPFTFREGHHSQNSSDEEGRSDEDGDRDSPLEVAYPIAMLENMHMGTARRPGPGSTATDDTAIEEETVGPQNPDYFAQRTRTVGLPNQYNWNDLVLHGLVTAYDVDKLFKIYHAKLNTFIPLLDPVLHTPEETFKRCPCLFTVVCAITSRYYDERKDLYPVAMHFAKNECANALMHGLKSVGLAQAFILLAMYHNPAKRWEEERAYLYAGLAMRIAIDLNLHVTPVPKPGATEREERDMLDRLRLWMICYETDWNMASHYGKPASVKENQIILTSDDFWRRSRYNLVGDIGLAAYNRLLRTVSEFHTQAYDDPMSRTGLNKNRNFREMYGRFSDKLDDVEATWKRKFAECNAFDKDATDKEIYSFRCSLLPYAINYCRLVMGCFGFQQTFEKGKQSVDRDFMNKCRVAATAVVVTFIRDLAPSGFMRYAPNGWFNFCSFACAFLIKLLRPEFSAILHKEEEDAIVALVYELIETLRSENVAIDKLHSPKLWARFLGELIAKKGGERAVPMSVETPTAAQPPPAPQYNVPVDISHQQYQPIQQGGAQMDYYQWPLAEMGAVPDTTGQATTQATMYASQAGGYMVGNGFYQPSTIAMNVDEDMRMAITAAIEPSAPFWDDGNVMMPGFPSAWTDSPPSATLADLATDPTQQALAQWFSST